MVSISSFMYLKISRKGIKRLGGRSDQHPCLAKLPLGPPHGPWQGLRSQTRRACAPAVATSPAQELRLSAKPLGGPILVPFGRDTSKRADIVVFDADRPIVRSSDLRGRYGTVSEVTVVRQKRFNPHYITAFLRSVAGQMQIERFITGATGQLHLYGRDVSKFWVPVVPSGVQLEFEHGYCRQARAPGVPRIVGSRETSRRNRHRGLRDGSFGLAVRCDGGTMTRAC